MADKGFIIAKELAINDCLVTSDGTTKWLKLKKTETLKTPVKVYNFAVEDYHTYFVGSGILVHNKCGTVGETSSNSNIITDPSRLLEATANPQDHHIIPAFRGKSKPYADFVKNLGIDVDQYTITVSGGKGGMYMNFIHGKGKWNQKWMIIIQMLPQRIFINLLEKCWMITDSMV